MKSYLGKARTGGRRGFSEGIEYAQKQTKKVFIYEAPDQYGDGQVGCIVIVATNKKEADTILSEIKYSEDYIFKTELDLTKTSVAYSNYKYSMKKER